MSAEKELKVIFLGRYNFTEKLSGPEKVSKRIFAKHTKYYRASFIQYFFDGNKFSLWQKLFSKMLEHDGENEIYTAGIFKIYGLLKQLKPDIIHITMFERFALIAVIYKMFNDVKIVYNLHGVIAYENTELKRTGSFYRLKDRFCEKRFLEKANSIIFVSQQALDIADKYYNVDKPKVSILPNGVDEIFDDKSSKDFNQKLKAVFIYQNELYNSGLNMLKKYTEHHKGLELYIITDKEINIDAVLIKPMPANELAEFYKDKHMLLSLNKYDTFSIASAEAMASGLVPIVTANTGISRFINQGVNGYVIEYGNVESLSKTIEDYNALTIEEKIKISDNVSEIYNQLNWTNVYMLYKDIYEKLT